MNCCGKTLTTPFCPFCGKQAMESGPITDLVLHIRELIKRDQRKIAAIKNGTAKKFTTYTGEFESRERSVKRWSERLGALMELIDSARR